MAENELIVTAGLNFSASESFIISQLKTIQDNFNQAGGLQIDCAINTNNLSNLQSQLNSMSRGLSIGVNTENVQQRVLQTVSVIQQNLDRNALAANVNFNINQSQIERFTHTLTDLLHVQGVDTEQLQQRLQNLGITIEKITPSFTQASRAGERFLSAISIKGVDASGNIVTYVENFNRQTHEFQNSTLKVEENFAKIRKAEEEVKSETEAVQKAMNDFLRLQGKYDLYSKKFGNEQSLQRQFAEISRIIQGFGSADSLEARRESIIRLDSALKLIKVDIDALNQSASGVGRLYPNISFESGSSTSSILQSAKEQLNTYLRAESIEGEASRVKRAIEDTSGSLQQFYVQVERGDKSVETLTYALNSQGNAYEYLGKVIREADNSTDFRRKDITTQWEIQTQELEQFITKAEKAGLSSTVLADDIANLRNAISIQGDTNAMNAFLDSFDIAKAKLQALNGESSVVQNSIKTLNQLLENTTFANNKNNPAVIQQVADIESLRREYNQLVADLSTARDPQSLQQINNRLAELKPRFDAVVESSNALKNSLKDSEAAAKLESGVKRLTNQMDVFANTNRRATESLRLMRDGQTTFAAKWQELSTAIRSGSLSAADLKRLSAEFQAFKGEADAAGMTVSRFFQSMQSQLRMVLQRWISLYAVIGYIRKMIDNVKELDTAMINLRRVTDETDAGYQRFLQDANELARQMKTTTSSLIEMSYQWSKLGYSINDALELAKSSTIFMRVADVGQDQALSNLVTALKAFRLEAGQTMDVVDKLDKLNNEYAVSAAGLGDGLERTASAMAMTGNSLDEALALLTGAGEITQNLENTGNALRTISLRLQNMKGKLEELGEPVDDLMEVSKVQTQILNLTHNQVDIINQSTGEFRSTYEILQDIAEVWDSLNSQSRSSLLEIIAGKNRANIGAALIQSFQSGQTQSALKATQDAYGTAENEYKEMMKGIQAQFDAFKGAFQEFSNAFIESDFLKGFVNFGTKVINFLTVATDKVGSLVVILTPFLMYFGGRTKTNIFSAIINGLKGLVTAETGAITASGALTTALKVLGGAISGLAIGALVAGITYAVDKLTVSAEEAEETVNEISSDIGDLARSTEELEKSQSSIENIAQSYSKVATTVTDVNERKSQLLELQNQLTDQFKDEADGIDFVNGKYSEQIKKLQELSEQQRRQYEIENADKIARARRLANLNVEAPDKTYASFGVHNDLEEAMYHRTGDREGELALFTLEDIDAQAIQLAKDIDGAYEAYSNFGNLKGIYLSGTLEDARNQLAQIIDNYSKLRDVDSETLNKLTQRYKELNDALNEIKEVTPYIENLQYEGFFGGMFGGFADAINSAVEDVTMQPFYDKVEEAQEKLKQLANPDNLTIAEYDTLYHDVQNLEHELYKMADGSEQNTQVVTDLFNAFKQGTSENGDSLEKFVEQFNTTLEESFKQAAETVTGVQDAMSKLAEGKGLSHSDAWKLLKEDTDGYLQSIKLVNGEYFFSQEELIKFKDAKIKASMEDLKVSNEQYVQERKNQLALLETQKEALKLALENLNVKAAQGVATRAELDAVTKARIAIAETEDSIKRYEGLWKRNNLLIEELNQNLGETRTLSLATETELNNAVKALENEAKVVDDTIDSLNDRKELIEKEKSALQEELELLNEQKETIEETLKNYDAVADAVSEYVKEQTDGIQSQIDALEEERKAIEDYYNDQIDVLKEQNEERDDAIKKEKALADLANAQNQQRRVYSSARGWTYETSKEDVVQAQNALAEIESEEQIKKLEKERDSRLGGFDDRKKEYETQIKAFEEYSAKYSSIASDIQKAENALLADQILGSNWREQIEQKDEGLLTKYRSEYQQFNSQLKNLVNNEILTLQASIDAKDEEIKMIDNEIKAYNDYKDTVQTKLGEAKTELENYKNNVADYCSQISDSFYHMQDEIWNNHNKIIGWFGAVAAAARSMRDEIGAGAVGGALMGLHLAGFADGGVADSTGLAMLHGTKQKGEVIFNAADSKKLYDLVHNTPSLIASVAKQAGQLTGANITNNNGSSTNSINVNIGQVVANNPREFTQNLDSHLDAYFRKKLTLSYTQ